MSNEWTDADFAEDVPEYDVDDPEGDHQEWVGSKDHRNIEDLEDDDMPEPGGAPV